MWSLFLKLSPIDKPLSMISQVLVKCTSFANTSITFDFLLDWLWWYYSCSKLRINHYGVWTTSKLLFKLISGSNNLVVVKWDSNNSVSWYITKPLILSLTKVLSCMLACKGTASITIIGPYNLTRGSEE